MESLRCFCGVEVAGADEDALFLAMREHLDETHHWQPTDELPRAMLREVLAQQAQMAPWDGTLLSAAKSALIRAEEARGYLPMRGAGRSAGATPHRGPPWPA